LNSGRLIGLITIVVGALVAVLAIAYVAINTANGMLSAGGAILGLAIALLVIVAPLVGFGIYMLVQSNQDAKAQARAADQRRLLDIVRSRGQVDITDLAVEMQVSPEALRDMIHQLVGLQVFSGYVHWDKGMLYSAEARSLRELQKCHNCGGEIELVGKGVVTCRFCGTEYYLS